MADQAHSELDIPVEQIEIQVRRAKARAKLAKIEREGEKAKEPPIKERWWQGSQISLLLIGGILTLAGNIGVAYYNGTTSRDQEAIKAQNALDLEREKAKATLILQAIASNNPSTAQRNILFFVEAGFISDPSGQLRVAANKYLPVLPSPGSVPQNAIAPADYAKAFWSVSLQPEKILTLDAAVDKIVGARVRLETVGQAVGTPWYVVGIIWLSETGGSFSRHLHNGDPLTARTVNVPAGRPPVGNPPFSWEDSAIDALRLFGLGNLNSKDLASTLDAIERVNGLGYRARGVSSPYLWAFTNGYTAGKFVGDGTFDPQGVSAQPGAVAILRRLQERKIIALETPVQDAAGNR